LRYNSLQQSHDNRGPIDKSLPFEVAAMAMVPQQFTILRIEFGHPLDWLFGAHLATNSVNVMKVSSSTAEALVTQKSAMKATI
jgi:hypothetical protein